MLTITILCIGKLKEPYLRDACREYDKRLGAFCKLNLVELEECRCGDRPGQNEIRRVLEKEGAALLSKIPPQSAVIALCIEGKQWSSEEFAGYLQQQPVLGCSHITFVSADPLGCRRRLRNGRSFGFPFQK